MTSDPSLTRLNVNLNQETAAALRYVADMNGDTFTNTIRRAVAVIKWIEDEKANGRIILSSEKNGKDQLQWVFL